MRDKGHLGIGADADITIYDDRTRPRGDVRRAAPRDQGRAPVVEDDELRERRAGRLLRAGVEYDPSIEATLEKLFADRYSVQFSTAIPCTSRGCSTRAHRRRGAAMKLHGARDRRHVRRGLPDVGSAGPDHRGDAGVGARGGALDDRLRDSVIGCKCEAGIERALSPDETPDGRPGVSALLFAMDKEGLAERLSSASGIAS